MIESQLIKYSRDMTDFISVKLLIQFSLDWVDQFSLNEVDEKLGRQFYFEAVLADKGDMDLFRVMSSRLMNVVYFE